MRVGDFAQVLSEPRCLGLGFVCDGGSKSFKVQSIQAIAFCAQSLHNVIFLLLHDALTNFYA